MRSARRSKSKKQSRDKREKKKLHTFAHRGNLSGIKKILDSKPQWLNANLEVQTIFETFSVPLCYCSFLSNFISTQVGDGHALIHRCATRGELECIEWLLEQDRIDIDALDDVRAASVDNILILLQYIWEAAPMRRTWDVHLSVIQAKFLIFVTVVFSVWLDGIDDGCVRERGRGR